MIGSTHLELKLFKKQIKKLTMTTIKALRTQHTSKNFLIKKFTLPLNLIVLNTANLSNSFHDQTFLKGTIFSALKSRVNVSLTDLRICLKDIYFLTLQYIE